MSEKSSGHIQLGPSAKEKIVYAPPQFNKVKVGRISSKASWIWQYNTQSETISCTHLDGWQSFVLNQFSVVIAYQQTAAYRNDAAEATFTKKYPTPSSYDQKTGVLTIANMFYGFYNNFIREINKFTVDVYILM